ncbi:MAG: hypothetical protein P8076_15370 [Gammaproteobacteria bacterium]
MISPANSYPVLARSQPPAARAQRTVAPWEPAAPEPVLQGELLQRQRAQGQGPWSDGATIATGQRREDHPGFQTRASNDGYLRRRAISAYQAQASASGRAVSGRTNRVDYFA